MTMPPCGDRPPSATALSAPSELGVSRETVERLAALVDLTLLWNRRINLTGTRDAAQLWQRHVMDSLQLAALIPARAQSAADLGSGGGYPGLVLAVATGLPFTLIEADRRKAAFLTEAARITSAPVAVLCERVESAHLWADLITSRATASLGTLLGWSSRLLRQGGTCLFLAGAEARTDVADAAARWNMRLEVIASRTNPAGTILRIEALTPRAMQAST